MSLVHCRHSAHACSYCCLLAHTQESTVVCSKPGQGLHVRRGLVVILESQACCVHMVYRRTIRKLRGSLKLYANYAWIKETVEITLHPLHVAQFKSGLSHFTRTHVTNEGILSCFPGSLLERYGLAALDCIHPFSQHLIIAITALGRPASGGPLFH